MRAACRAGVGLGVKPPVARIVVFVRTLRAHLENSHRGARTIVRQSFDDGEAGSAVGAVGEGITVAPIGGVEDFPLTFTAGRNVRQDQRGLGAVGALPDLKLFVGYGIGKAVFEALYERNRRLLPLDAQ